VDLSKVTGISDLSFLNIISEIGTDMSKWQNDKYFAAWLNVAPNTKITGGKIISSKMQKKKNHCGQTLRMCANSVKSSKSPLGDYARKMKSRLGKNASTVAIAHKLAIIIYKLLKDKCEYNPEIIEKSQEKWKLKKIANLERQLKYLKTAV
jgi:transposase